MKSVYILLTITAFIGISVFGYLAINHSGDNHKGCIAAMSAGINCPSDFFASVNFHLNTLKGFALASFVNDGLNFSLILLLVLVISVLLTRKLVSKCYLVLPIFFKIHYGKPLVYYKERFRNWLAIHENSPALS